MQILFLTAIVGVVGMGLGAAISAFFGTISNRVMCWLLSFAGGVMISVVAFKLIPTGIEMAGIPITVLGLVLGVACVAGLNYLLNKSAQKNKDRSESICCHSDHAKQLICSPALTRSGIILLVALSLHKLPEGIAIGAAGTHNITLGFILAFTAILHCLPEGMAIGAPLICGGMSKKKAIFLTALGGTPTIIGGAIGMLVGGISDVVLAFVLSIAAGTMLFVVFGEIIPQSLNLTKSKLTTYAAMAGILTGLIAVFVFASPICPHGHNHLHSHTHSSECGHEHPHTYDCDYDHSHSFDCDYEH
jgi:ZIP family zinc transporter